MTTSRPSPDPRFPTRPERQNCGHDPYRVVLVRAINPAGDTSGDTSAFLLRSLVGGRQELTSEPCPHCRSQPVYRHRSGPGAPAVDIGTDPEVVRAALHTVLDQPGVDVFTLVVTGSQGIQDRLTSYVLPRPHLPAFRVRDRS